MDQRMTELLRLAQRGRRAEKRSKMITEFIGATLFGLLLAFLTGFELMLLLGILHRDVAPAIPPLGYWLCFVLVLLGGGVVRGLTAKYQPRKDAS